MLNSSTTFAPNAIERKHRFVKDLVYYGYERFSAAELMHQVCEILSARIVKGHYNNLVNEIPEAWDGLWRWPQRQKKCGRDEVHDVILR